MIRAALKEKIGQMFMIGFHGTTLTDELREMITDYKIGGVILFSRNIESKEQVKDLCNSLQELSIKSHRIPLLIAIDQEGGRVFRLKAPFRQYPSYGEMGKGGSEDLVRANALLMADELIEIGINMNMAPVLDVNTNPKNPIIGDRSFSSNPDIVSRLGACVIKAFHEKGVIAVGKHFPGHGDTSSDSHVELPVVNHGIKRLEEIEFKPFIDNIKRGLRAIMTAHVRYPVLDPDYPATMSERIITDILRKRLGFDGVVITDDMEMKAIANNYSDKISAVQSVKAGADILLICHNRDKQIEFFNSIFRALETCEIEKEKIEESQNRIARLKKDFIKI